MVRTSKHLKNEFRWSFFAECCLASAGMCCNNRYRVTLIICQDSLIVDRIAEFDHLSWFIGIVLKIAHAALDTYMSCEISTLNSSREIAGDLWFRICCKTRISIYRKVASSRPVYYSILNSFGQRSQYISTKFPLHKLSENS